MMTEISVLLATYNGEKVLPRTLEGYALQEDVRFEWKLVVVDNGSTDQTREVIERFQRRLKIDCLFEATAGKNCALNAGLQAIDGEAVIISDDDAIPQPDFLASWRRALSRHPSYDIFGGSVEPLFDVDPPEWMPRGRVKFAELFAARDLPEGPVEPGGIYGPNMAVRRSVFTEGLKFSESIGPDSTDINYPMGSETEFCIRAYLHGHKTWFAPEPRISHIVRSHQLEPRYCSQRAYRNGRGQAQMLWKNGIPVRRLGYSKAAIAAANTYQALRQSVRWYRTVTAVRPESRLDALWKYHENRGFRDEYTKRMKAFQSSQK
jgi:glucosyl-dolichyl phosphate glucuronosyltransferase